MTKVLLIEPFYGGSHKQFIDQLNCVLSKSLDCTLITLCPKKWHWSIRVSALILSTKIPHIDYENIFASASFNFSELLGIRPNLIKARKVLYFHENQLIYPLKNDNENDFQLGYSQILSCIAADEILFNSSFNKESFFNHVRPYLNKCPITLPTEFIDDIIKKSRVLYIIIERPLKYTKQMILEQILSRGESNLKLVWPHRWEHDKNPQTLVNVIRKLAKEYQDRFHLSIIGQSTQDVPSCLSDLFDELNKTNIILNKGYQRKEDYWSILSESDVVLSTAMHEFYGISMLEGVALGCIPLCPNRLVYPELFHKDTKFNRGSFYNTENQLFKILSDWITRPLRARRIMIEYVEDDYENLLINPRIIVQQDEFCSSHLYQEYLDIFSRDNKK